MGIIKSVSQLNIINFFIIILAVVLRLLPHPPNFVPIGGLALFSGAHFSGKKAFLIPWERCLFPI